MSENNKVYNVTRRDMNAVINSTLQQYKQNNTPSIATTTLNRH
jgi:hypothetical protein